MSDVDPGERWSETTLAASELCSIATGLATALRREAAELPDPDRRQWRRLISTDDFDAWVIHWPIGGSVDPHDHGGSTGAVSVVRGELTEVRSTSGAFATQRLVVGSAHVVPSDAVHDIVNDGPAAAVSVHVYSPPLSTMVFYGPDGDALRAEAVELERAVWPEVIAGMAATA
jgi:hypothetical protein